MHCDTGKQKKYYHHSCWTLELERREQLTKEKAQWGALIDYIKTIHNLYDVPPSFFPFIQDIRNGTVRFQGPVQHKQKQGIGYDVILEAYRMSADSIKWAREHKDFTINYPFSELKYGLRIVTGNMNRALERCRAKERISTTSISVPVEDGQTEYKPRQHKNDIVAFLEE